MLDKYDIHSDDEDDTYAYQYDEILKKPSVNLNSKKMEKSYFPTS